jgi:hypothetical protein
MSAQAGNPSMTRLSQSLTPESFHTFPGRPKFFFQGDVSASQTATKFTYEFEITGSKLKMTAGPFKDPAGGPEFVVVTTYDRVE